MQIFYLHFFLLAFPENQEKFFLYLFISVTVGVLLCLTLVIGRLVLQKKRQAKSDKKSSPKNQSQNGGNAGETTIPNGFSDDISEIDGDIDMTTTTLPMPSVSRNEVSCSTQHRYLQLSMSLKCRRVCDFQISVVSIHFGYKEINMNMGCHIPIRIYSV